ncbi:MAG: patatin-like phospholipase family protein [Peptostreptococcaceae bacterium]|nr:patatin-like phospholipase family protein [Peptostreptococcaceae bacterium]
MLGLVLGGGGAKGSYQIGVWKALKELDIPIDLVVGTSIGSLNAAFVAQGDYEKALTMWNTFDAGKMFDIEGYDKLDTNEKLLASMHIFAKDFIHEGGIEATEYKKAIQKFVDEKKVRASSIQFGLVTYDLSNQKPVEIPLSEIKTGQLTDYIMASSAIIPAVKPYEIDGVKYIDGGFYDVVPMNLALVMGATELIAVDLSAVGVVKKTDHPENIGRLRYIKPYWDLGSVLIFEDRVVQRNIALGYFDTLKSFGAYDGRAYTFIKEKTDKHIETRMREILGAQTETMSLKKSRFSLADSITESKWKSLSKEHTTVNGKKLSDLLLCVEIVAEMLKIDPTKIYTLESMNHKIRQKLSSITLDTERKNAKSILTKLTNDLSTIADEGARLKYFAREIQKSLKAGDDFRIQKLAPVFTKEFFGGLYIAVCDLL